VHYPLIVESEFDDNKGRKSLMIDNRNALASIAYLALDAQGKMGGGKEPTTEEITIAVVRAAEMINITDEPGTIAAEIGAISDVSQRHLYIARKWQEGTVVNLGGAKKVSPLNGHKSYGPAPKPADSSEAAVSD
jgi:hypothetical protein